MARGAFDRRLENVRKELAALTRVFGTLAPVPAGLDGLKRDLKAINEMLWDIENRTRAKEAAKVFDDEFIGLTRSVYQNNDKRAGIKRRINDLLQSELVEEKYHAAASNPKCCRGVKWPL